MKTTGFQVCARLAIRAVLWWLICPAAVPAASTPEDAAVTGGLAQVEITPNPNLTNWIGHQPYNGVLDPLLVRALVLAEDSNRVAIVCWDLVDARESTVARMRRAIAAETGIPASNVLIMATHTHSAPWSPVYEDKLLAHERKNLDLVHQDPLHQAWAADLERWTIKAVKQADLSKQPLTLGVGRAWVGEVLFNRRPRRPDGRVDTVFQPADPYVLPSGLRFGPVDPTLTLLVLHNPQGRPIGALFHVACHPVAVYPFHKGVSGDWPGAAATRLGSDLGGIAVFLQGCCGDIVPARRGLGARDQMAQLMAERALAASKQTLTLSLSPLQALSVRVALPLSEPARKELGQDTLEAEVQVLRLGSLALVALPGEPLSGLAERIGAQSPYPHTLVLGYANGYGVGYVGLPGEKARGGYEMSPVGAGADQCGGLLVETAVRLLQELQRNEPGASKAPEIPAQTGPPNSKRQ